MDLVGGYYDAGDNVKFGLPMAFTVTMLAWGVIQYEKQMSDAGEYQHALEAIKWGTDYFIKAHTQPNVLWVQVTHYSCGISSRIAIVDSAWDIYRILNYIITIRHFQVGDGYTDHYCWQRPEDMTTSRQAYKVDEKNPGSDVAGETAAALAAASIVFRRTNPHYSYLLLHHAKEVS